MKAGYPAPLLEKNYTMPESVSIVTTSNQIAEETKTFTILTSNDSLMKLLSFEKWLF